MVIFICVIAIILISPSSKLSAQEVSLGGYIKGFIFQQLGSDWLMDRAGSRIQLKVEGGYGPAYFYGAIDFEADSRLLTSDKVSRKGEGFDIYPVELFINLSFGDFDFFLGQQFIFWGKTTWVNPTDIITPWDFANMSSETEDYRVAPFALRINWYTTDNLQWDIVWIPVFQPNRIPNGGVPNSMGSLPVVSSSSELPEKTIQNGEFALRLSHSVSRLAFDWSLSVYKGFEKFAAPSIVPIIPENAVPPIPTGFSWTNHYHPLWMVGADFSKTVNHLLFKGEVALKLTDDWEGIDPEIKNSRLEYVVGIDYAYNENFALGIQYIGNWLINYDPEKDKEDLKDQSEEMFFADSLSHSTSLFIKWNFTDQLGAQILGLYNINDYDFFSMAFVWWAVSDGVKLFLGAVGFGGRDDYSPNGRQQENSRLFLELKASF